MNASVTPAAAQVLGILEKRYPCKRAPWGTYRRIGEEVGLTPQRVQQIASAAGWRPVLPPKPLYECICGRVQKTSRLCHDCRFVDLPCEQCGTPRRVSIAELVWNVAHFPGPHHYSGRVFRGRECFGRWLGSRFASRPRRPSVERQSRLKALLLDRYPDHRAPHGAWSQLSRELGLGADWVSDHAREMGWRIQTGMHAAVPGLFFLVVW